MSPNLIGTQNARDRRSHRHRECRSTLDLPALTAAFNAAHPELRPSTRASLAAQLRAAVNGYRTRNQPDPADPFTPPAPEAETSAGQPESDSAETREDEAGEANGGARGNDAGEQEFNGTLGELPRFTEHARRSGLFSPVAARNYLGAVRRILSDQPHLKTVPASDADPDAIMKRFAEDHGQLKPITIESYRVRLARIIAAYTTYLADRRPTAAFVNVAPTAPVLEIPLPGARTVRFSAPPDLTDQEAAATGALLRLHHPGITAPPSIPGTWTLVFWPESAPDEPEAAHLTGPTFRRALADHIRARCPDLADHDDETAIDAWYATEVFVALAFDGHHHARDSGTLL